MLHPILLEIHEECKHRDNFDYHSGWLFALIALDNKIKAGKIILERYVPGEGISLLETHERMRREGKL